MDTFKPSQWLMPFLSLCLISMTISGCQPNPPSRTPEERAALGPDNSRSIRPQVQIPKEYLPPSSSEPTQIPVKCAANQCPNQVGLVLFYLNEVSHSGKRAAKRCTGSLVAPDLVLSNGHCDQTQKGEGYFITQDGQSRRITGVIFKEFTPAGKNKAGSELSSGRPDAALYRLEKPVDNIVPLQIATGKQPLFTELTAYVINTNPRGKGYIVESVTCPVRRHGALWPYDLAESPDVILGFQCKTQAGNSGAPMFAAGSDAIQALYFGFGDPVALASASNRPLYNFEKHWVALATNLRCLDLPGMPSRVRCQRADSAENVRRFETTQESTYEKLNNRPIPNADQYPFEFESLLYPLAYDSASVDRGYEILYFPKCRKSDGAVSEVVFPQEYVVITFDQWGEVLTESREMRVTTAKVLKQMGKVHRLSTSWQPAFDRFLKSEKNPTPDLDHPRRKFGSRFSIDLPLCSR